MATVGAGENVPGITDQAKAILAEVVADGTQIGSDLSTLAATVATAVSQTSTAAGAAISNLIETLWSAAKAKFGS